MSLELTRQGTLSLIKVIGSVDADSAHLLVELVDCLIPDQPVKLVVDLSRTTLLSAHGLTALLQVQHAVTAVDGQLALRDPSPIVRYMLSVSGALHQFDVHDGAVRHCPEPRMSRRRESPSVAFGTTQIRTSA